MKYLYLTVLSFLTIVRTEASQLEAHLTSRSSNATPSGEPFQQRGSRAPSDAGSVRSVATLRSVKSEAKYTAPAAADLLQLSYEELIAEYMGLFEAYKKSGDAAKRKDARVDTFLKEQLSTLSRVPGVLERSDDTVGKSHALRGAIETLVSMYRTLERTSNTSANSVVSTVEPERVAELETTIAILTAGTAELEETVAQLKQRPETAETGTAFSPERQIPFSSPARLRETALTVTKQAGELETLRAEVQRLNDENTQLRSRQLAADIEVAAKDDAEVKSLRAELERLQAENAELKRAQKDAAKSQKPRVVGSSAATESTPLAADYVALDDTSAINAGGKKKGQGCPCSVM